MISHDIGVLAEMCYKIAVMYAGRFVELSDTKSLFKGALASVYKGPIRFLTALFGKGEKGNCD